jgi:uncharacterized protein YdaU (DUF1376 family)
MTTKNNIWMPWYPSDYLKRTMHLSLEEDAFYRRAIDLLWINNSLTTNLERLKRTLRVTDDEWNRCKWIMEEFFEIKNESYTQSRIEEEKEKIETRAKKARENGRLGGRPPKPTNNPQITQSVILNNPDGSQNITQKKASHSHSHKSYKEDSIILDCKNEVVDTLVEQVRLGPVEKKVKQIFEFWKEELNHPNSILDKKRDKVIRERLKEGFTVERIMQAILGIKSSPHNMGQNDRKTVYDDIELICRTGANVDRFADMRSASDESWKNKYAKFFEGENYDETGME